MAESNTTQVFRLSPEAYSELEKHCNPPFVQETTTDLQAGFMLGIQHVLSLLRKGYVIGT